MTIMNCTNNFNSAIDSSKPVKRLNEELKLSTDSV